MVDVPGAAGRAEPDGEPGTDTVFDGEPRMRADYLAVDWARTALGEPRRWPQSLRATVGLMLRSRFSMWMAWGPELTFFCNDAYRRDTLGIKYPWALGRPATEVWAEIWEDIGPLADRVIGAGESTWDESLLLFLERNGYPEETYHTFSYSPLLDESGTIAGLFCVVTEDTAKVISERRITTLRDLSAPLVGAHTEAEVYSVAQGQLAASAKDLTFAAYYRLDAAGDSATRVLLAGAEPGDPAFPEHIVLDDPGSPWSAQLPRPGDPRIIEDPGAAGTLPTGAWDQPAKRALSVALARPGEDVLDAFLVIGANPHRPLGEDYVGFVELVAAQIALAVERARTFEAERLRAEQMAELDRAKTTFFTNVSHELRTPLTLLLGPTADALADVTEPLGPRQRERLEFVSRNGERLLKLVNTLLDFSRLESGRTQPNFAAVELGQLTAELASMFESAVRGAGLSLEVDCPPLPELAWVDPEMWSKIVVNLLSNAIKATFAGGITVRLHPGAEGHGLALTVADSGIGIDAAEQGRLFERFHRIAGAPQRSHEGSGIGLALVAELAALHDGTVSVESALGSGSTFTVTLPDTHAHVPAGSAVQASGAGAAALSAGDVAGAVSVGDVAGAVSAGYVAEATRWLAAGPAQATIPEPGDDERPRLLVVDDNADMREYLIGLLAGEYAVQTASDGAAALDLARAAPPDLVLTDVMMPVLDGFGLLGELRADPATLHVPVVMISARSGEDSAVEGLEAGANDYLVKPFTQRELLARVHANLELDRVRRVAAELERGRALVARAEALARVGSFEYDIVADRLTGTEQYFRMLGAQPDDMVRDGFAAAESLVHPDDRDAVAEAARQSIATAAPLQSVFRVGAGEATRTMFVLGTVELDPQGNPVRMIGSLQDITERVAAEQAERAAAAAREVAAREHEIASGLQAGLLPRRSYDADHLDVAGFYQAGVEGTQVGGDWYDVIELDAGRTALVLGDVMGRGVPAAVVMGQLRATVRAYARLELAPDTLLHLLDSSVREISDDMIVTCVYAVYDPIEQTLTYANAGHLPPLLTPPDGATRQLTGGGPPLGAGHSWGPAQTIAMPVGTTVTLFTDGLVEQRGNDVDDGIRAAARLLDAADGPVADVPGMLADGLLRGGQDDDVAVIVARVSDRAVADRVGVTPVDSKLSAVAGARDFAAERLGEWGVDENIVDDVRLIVSELVTNAIVHGAAPIQLRLRVSADRLLIETLDSALSMPQLRYAKPTDDNGRGLLIVSLLSERWGTRPTQSGKSVWCQLPLS